MQCMISLNAILKCSLQKLTFVIQVFVDASPSSHLVSALQRVSYVADSRDSGANITCTAAQIGQSH